MTITTEERKVIFGALQLARITLEAIIPHLVKDDRPDKAALLQEAERRLKAIKRMLKKFCRHS